MSKLTKKKFLDDVKDHKLTIFCDDGEARHIRLENPKNSYYWFNLTTWKDHLCISSNMGTRVFRRYYTDMFSFFRSESEEEQELQINPCYWHEKLVSDDVSKQTQEFSAKVFEEFIIEGLQQYCEDEDISEDIAKSLKKSIENAFEDVETFQEAFEMIELQNWISYIDLGVREDTNRIHLINFAKYLADDTCEIYQSDFQSYTHNFIWCLYAIVWGISQYDKIKLIDGLKNEWRQEVENDIQQELNNRFKE